MGRRKLCLFAKEAIEKSYVAISGISSSALKKDRGCPRCKIPPSSGIIGGERRVEI